MVKRPIRSYLSELDGMTNITRLSGTAKTTTSAQNFRVALHHRSQPSAQYLRPLRLLTRQRLPVAARLSLPREPTRRTIHRLSLLSLTAGAPSRKRIHPG